VKTAAPIKESSCFCTLCLKALPCQHWRYADIVPIRQAKALLIEDLLARTNPGLEERLQLQEQICALGGDSGFGIAFEQLDSIRPGALRSKLLKRLLAWNGLPLEQRELLGQQIAVLARAWPFSCQIAPTFPVQVGCLPSVLTALIVWSAFLWMPAVHSWLWGSITVLAGLLAAALTRQLLVTRNVCKWTRKVLIPEAQEANISLACFLAVVDDVPGSRLGMTDELWPIKIELETVRRVLRAEGKL
jgi:hypothetical protein